MNYQQAINRLINHANISEKTDLSEDESLVYHLWTSTRLRRRPIIAPLRRDILHCLQTINIQINGHKPSKTMMPTRSIDEELVVIISDIIHSCINFCVIWTKKELFDEQTRWELQLTTWMISFAWNAILAGDIDDIEQEIHYALVGEGLV